MKISTIEKYIWEQDANWLFSEKKDETRYLLGIKGTKPLICFGINPSTAKPKDEDNTIRAVVRWQKRLLEEHKYDSWIMLNIYPQRSTQPDGLHSNINEEIHKENLKVINDVLSNFQGYGIWAAWGTNIKIRPFIKSCLVEINEIVLKNNSSWKHLGNLTKYGHPHHPLYLKSISIFHDFNITEYLTKF